MPVSSSEQNAESVNGHMEESRKDGRVPADVQTSPSKSEDQINDRNSNEQAVLYLFYVFFYFDLSSYSIKNRSKRNCWKPTLPQQILSMPQ